MTKRWRVIFPVLMAMLVTLALPVAPVAAQDAGTAVISDLNAPQGVLVAPDGSVWVVDSGVGGENEVAATAPSGAAVTATYGDTAQVVRLAPDGTQSVVALLPSVSIGQETTAGGHLALLDGEVYVANGVWIGTGAPDEAPGVPLTAAILKIGADGTVSEVVPTWRIERRMNPDNTVIQSHPYGLAAGPDGKLWVADSGGNTLLRVEVGSGTIELLTTFPALPGVFPNPLRGGEMLADPVPTGIAFDDDGNALVSLLSGTPFVPGSAKVVKVTPRGARSDFATGQTMLTDIRRGPDGNFYGVQYAIFTDQGPTPNSGAIVKFTAGMTTTEAVVDGLSLPTSVDFDADGNAYIAINGRGAPGSGAVLKYDGVAAGVTYLTAAAAEATPEPTAEPAPEMMDIVDTAASSEAFSTLVAAVQAAGLVDALKGEGPFTVFAPTNEAFAALPPGTVDALLADPTGDLTNILLFHVVGGKVMAADVADGLTATALQGGELAFDVADGAVTVNGVNIISTDIEATNGVIHVIDAVLLPPAEEAAAEATPVATEEPAAEATPVATEEAAPETLPNTGGGLPSAFSVITAVLSLLALGLGSLSLRRRQS